MFRRLFARSVAVMALGLLAPGAAMAADPQIQQLLEEVRRLNQRVGELEAEKTQRVSDAAADLDKMTVDAVSAAGQGSQGNVWNKIAGPYQNNIVSNTSVGGYASIEYGNFEDQDSFFDQHRFILNVGSQLTDRIKFYSEIEYEHGATFESEGTSSGEISIVDTNGNGVIDADEAQNIPAELDTDIGRSGEISIEQAWMQYDFNQNLGIRGGVLLVPFGRFNLTHDDDLHVFTDRPLVARRVSPSTWQDSGIGFVYNTNFGEESRVWAELYAINGLRDTFEGGSDALREARSDLGSDNNNNKAIVGRVAVSPWVGTEVGLSGYTGAYDRNGNDINAGSFDWFTKVGDFEFLGETSLFKVDEGLSEGGDPAPKSLSGIWAELRYYFWFDALNSTFMGKGFSDPKLVAGFRYNKADIERRGALAELNQEGYVLGLTYKPTTSFLIKTEYQFNDGELERKNADGFLASMAIGF